MVVRSKVWIYDLLLAAIAVSNPVGGMDVCLARARVCVCVYQVEIGLITRPEGPTEFVV